MIYLLPGMGATSAMYEGPWRELEDSLAINWPEYRGEKTIEELSQRMIMEHKICSDDILIGSSLGGIVALEIHRVVAVRRVILVGSAISRDEINPLLIALAPLAKITPIRLIQTLVGKGPTLASAMLADADGAFIKAMCNAIAKWEGYTGTTKTITRIHGEKDTVIPCPQNAHIIPDGGHLIAITHAKAIICIVQNIRNLAPS